MNSYKSTSQLKTEARGLLLGKYGIFIAALTCVEGIILLISLITSFALPTNDTWGTLLELALNFIISLIGTVFSLGLIRFTLNICRNQTYKLGDIFYGFTSHPDKAIVTCLLFSVAEFVCYLPAILFVILYAITENPVLMLVASLFFVIGLVFTVMIHLTYDFMYYLILDYPNATLRECFDYCGNLMKGHRIRFFYLQISFLPLLLLSLLSLGIGLLFVIPYQHVTITKFYLDIFHPDYEDVGDASDYEATYNNSGYETTDSNL